MAYKIEQKYITNTLARSRQRINKVLFLVAHETANNTADADNHYTYFQGITIAASAHTFIDDGKILEIIPLNEKAWHVLYNKPTDNRMFGADANDAAIGVELCRTGDFKKAYDRYVWYFAYLCKKFGLNPKKHIVSHKVLDPQRRSDPQSWLSPNGVSWDKFINDVSKQYSGKESTYTPPKTVTKPAKVTSNPSYALRQGDSGAAVKKMQQDLASVYFYPDKGAKNNGIDGIYGPKTKDAVRRFQSVHGLAQDGIFGPKTKAALDKAMGNNKPVSKPKSKTKSSLPNAVYRAKKPYPHSAGVRAVQEALASVYYYPNKSAKNHGVDGYYGKDTADAVRRFQSMHGLVADGVYGPATKKALEKAIKY